MSTEYRIIKRQEPLPSVTCQGLAFNVEDYILNKKNPPLIHMVGDRGDIAPDGKPESLSIPGGYRVIYFDVEILEGGAKGFYEHFAEEDLFDLGLVAYSLCDKVIKLPITLNLKLHRYEIGSRLPARLRIIGAENESDALVDAVVIPCEVESERAAMRREFRSEAGFDCEIIPHEIAFDPWSGDESKSTHGELSREETMSYDDEETDDGIKGKHVTLVFQLQKTVYLGKYKEIREIKHSGDWMLDVILSKVFQARFAKSTKPGEEGNSEGSFYLHALRIMNGCWVLRKQFKYCPFLPESFNPDLLNLRRRFLEFLPPPIHDAILDGTAKFYTEGEKPVNKSVLHASMPSAIPTEEDEITELPISPDSAKPVGESADPWDVWGKETTKMWKEKSAASMVVDPA